MTRDRVEEKVRNGNDSQKGGEAYAAFKMLAKDRVGKKRRKERSQIMMRKGVPSGRREGVKRKDSLDGGEEPFDLNKGKKS